MKQSCKDAESAEKGELPIVCHRKNRCDWLVTFRLDDLLDFAEKVSVLNQMEEFPY